MSMYTEADKIKEMIKAYGFTAGQLNVMVKFGQVAKFRCRSNTAYENFISACLDSTKFDLTRPEVQKKDGSTFNGFEVIQKIEA